MSPRGLFLDLYDTLLAIDQEKWTQGKQRAAAYLGLTLEEWLAAWGKAAHADQVGEVKSTEERAAMALKNLGLSPAKASQLAAWDLEDQQNATLVLPGVPEMLGKAHERGLTVVLVSNAGHSSAKILEYHGLDGYFAAQIFSFDVGARKPDPAMFRAALEAADLQGEEVFYAGDGDSFELDAAREQGMMTCRVAFPEKNEHFLNREHQSRHADFTISSWADLWSLPPWS